MLLIISATTSWLDSIVLSTKKVLEEDAARSTSLINVLNQKNENDTASSHKVTTYIIISRDILVTKAHSL